MDWYKKTLGQHILQVEQDYLTTYFDKLFGYYALQLAPKQSIDLLAKTKITHKAYIVPEISAHDAFPGIEALYTELPIQSDSIDIIVMPHLLEQADNPYQVLREVSRVLIPEGHLFLFGFNPFSLWGLRRLFTWKKTFPWQKEYYSAFRVKEWLRVIGFEIVAYKTHVFRPPIEHPGFFERLKFLELCSKIKARWGGVYSIVAKKKIPGMIPLKPAWQSLKKIDVFAKSNARGMNIEKKSNDLY